MQLNRIYAVVLRHLYHTKHSITRIFETFYWPIIDLILWGITSRFVQEFAGDEANIINIIISGIVLWIVVWQASHQITISVLEELWNDSMVTLFGSPLKVSEWIAAFFALGIIKGGLAFAWTAILAFILYQVEIFDLGFQLLPFLVLLIMFGWIIGLLVGSTLLRFGNRVEIFAWSIPALFAPFCAIYYPIETLPDFAQKIASIVPASYIFEGSREVLETGHLDWNKVVISFCLSIVYLVIAIILFKLSFKGALKRGLINFK